MVKCVVRELLQVFFRILRVVYPITKCRIKKGEKRIQQCSLGWYNLLRTKQFSVIPVFCASN